MSEYEDLKTGDIVAEALIDWGVDVVFGIPGDSINGFIEALRVRKDKIKFVLVRHEESAALMACGYAKYTGKLGVCTSIAGPGAIHLLNGLYDAKADNTPVIVITGGTSTDLMNSSFQQDVNLMNLFSDVSVYNSMIGSPRQAEMAVEAGSGHPGASFSAAEIMGVLYFHKMKHKPSDPLWEGRDYFVNSKAHSAPGFYAVLATAGYIDTKEIKTLRKLGSRLQGHPVMYSERQKNHSFPGIEYSGGSEGIGLSVSIGIALAKKRDGQKNRVYTLIGDGESNEGQIWEAAMAASKFKLDNLVAILDRNKIQQDGFTEEIMPLDPVRDKWAAFNWNVVEVNGHKIEQIIDALSRVEKVEDKPSIIIANTTKGKGIKHMANNPQWHGKAPPKKHVPILLEELQSEILIAPSIIAGEPENYEEKVRRAERAGADLIHLDIMDGKFVPTTSFFADTIKHLRKISSIPFDAHLMIEKPINHVIEYIDAGCDIITVHVEACNESEFVEINKMLLNAGISPGIAINPGTKFPSWIIEHLDNIDVMIIMSVNPGFAGQKFIPEALDKMAEVVKTLKSNNYKGFIEADGGIDATTLQQVFDAGARIMVAGNAVYGSPDINSNIIQLRHKANVAIETKLLELATINDMRSDWIKSRKNMLIPLAKELSIEEDLHAIK